MENNTPIIASWPVGAEDYNAMYNEAISDADLFMYNWPGKDYNIEVVNCTPEKQEESRIIFWKGTAILTFKE